LYNNLIETTESLRQTWQALFPNVTAPEDSQWALRLLLHDIRTVKAGIATLVSSTRTSTATWMLITCAASTGQ